jgi:hypothetical protein
MEQNELEVMPSSGVSHHVAFVRICLSEERIASIFRVKIISDLGTMLSVAGNRNTQRRVSSYKSHAASNPRRRHSS